MPLKQKSNVYWTAWRSRIRSLSTWPNNALLITFMTTLTVPLTTWLGRLPKFSLHDPVVTNVNSRAEAARSLRQAADEDTVEEADLAAAVAVTAVDEANMAVATEAAVAMGMVSMTQRLDTFTVLIVMTAAPVHRRGDVQDGQGRPRLHAR